MEGYIPKPESLTAPSRPPPAERTAKDQPFFYVPRNPDISPGSDAAEQEVLSRKKAAAASNALSMAEYIYNNPGMPELDLVSGCNFSWREANNKMLMRCFIALDNLKKKLLLIDEDQKLALILPCLVFVSCVCRTRKEF